MAADRQTCIRVEHEGEMLSLREIGIRNSIDPRVIRARHRAGDRGALLVRPVEQSGCAGWDWFDHRYAGLL